MAKRKKILEVVHETASGLRDAGVMEAKTMNVVIVPHYRFWLKKISNATNGSHSLLCVADFYLHPDHDAQAARARLMVVGQTSSYLKQDTEVSVVVQEKPWGTHYKLKAYVKESREQFSFITDLTICGKETLRAMNIRFAQAPYAETAPGYS